MRENLVCLKNYNHNRTNRIELHGMCMKINPRKYASWCLIRENLAAQKYLRLQYAAWPYNILKPSAHVYIQYIHTVVSSPDYLPCSYKAKDK